MLFAIRHLLAGLVLGLALPAGLLAAPPADWPGWRGPNRDGLSPDQGLLPAWTASGPPLAWKTTGIGVGFSSVAIAGNRLYTMGDTAGAQQLMAFNRSDGKPLWTARVGAPWIEEAGGKNR